MKYLKNYFLFFFILNLSLLSSSETSCDWIDLPYDDYQIILGMSEDDDQVRDINRIVQEYHLIPKDLNELLPLRINYLEKLKTFLYQIENKENFPAIKLLIDLTTKKLNYLIALSKIPEFDEIEAYHLNFNVSSNYKPIFLRNNMTYSLKMKEHWGAFWLETIDPCHRRLAHLYKFWLDHVSPLSQTDYLSFFLWLETQCVQKHIPIVKYYSDDEILKCQIGIDNGYLITSNSQELLTTPLNKRNVFIINLDEELFIETCSEGIWHTTLSLGKPVLAVGLMDVDRGMVKRISFESGHYLPDIKQSFQSIQILVDKGVRFVDPFELIYFENRNKYMITLPIDQIQDYEQLQKAMQDEFEKIRISTNEF